MTHPAISVEQHALFQLDDIHCPECADAVEQALHAQPHITSVHLDWAHNIVHVGYHPNMLTRDAIERVITGTGCACAPADSSETTPADHSAHIQSSDAQRLQRLHHAVDVQPITMGTKQDRMQYELTATAARPARDHHPSVPTQSTDHSGHGAMTHIPINHTSTGNDMRGMDNSGMGHDMGGMDHSAIGHDMSDPGMAAAMERDMRTKFFIALPLTILIVLYSPMGPSFFGITLPTLGVDMNLLMLLLTTPVIWYCGWMFISGAYHSLRRGMLNMSVLIAVGVLAAYVGSVVLMLLGGETFFEAGAMLVTFVLFGHWMEMRSRRGTNEALRALFDLVPPQATVLRDGAEITIPQ